MTTDTDPIRDRFCDAFDGALSVDERRAFDARLADDPDAADDYASFVAATRALRDAAPREAPDDHVEAVLAAVATAGPTARARRPWGLWSHAAAAVLGAAACLAVVLTLDDDGVGENVVSHDTDVGDTVEAPRPVDEPAVPATYPSAGDAAGSASGAAPTVARLVDEPSETARDATTSTDVTGTGYDVALHGIDGGDTATEPRPVDAARESDPAPGSVSSPPIADAVEATAGPAPHNAASATRDDIAAATGTPADDAADVTDARPRPAPLFELHVDGRRLASTWAGLRDDVAALLAESAARAEMPPPSEPPTSAPRRDDAVARADAPSPATPTTDETSTSPVARSAAPAEPPAPRDIAWPDELRDVVEPPAARRPASTVAAAALASAASIPAPQRDGVRLLSVDDEVSALRTRGPLVDVVPTLVAHLGDDDDPTTALAAEQLDQIAARLARDPAVATRLVTPRYAAPADDSWLSSIFGSDDGDETADKPTHDGSVASYWRAWYSANAALLAERLDAREA